MLVQNRYRYAVFVSIFGAAVLLGAAASAATFKYQLLDHPDGGASKASPFASYGLRLDVLNPDSYWSFENDGNATMTIDDGGGVAGAGMMSISGTMRQSFGETATNPFGDIWNVSYSISGLTVGANGTFTDTSGSGMGTLQSTVTTEVIALGSKANPSGQYFLFQDDGHRVPGNSELIGRGWVDNADNWPGANDFLFRVALLPSSDPGQETVVPIPAAGWLLLTGLGGLVVAGKRRKKA